MFMVACAPEQTTAPEQKVVLSDKKTGDLKIGFLGPLTGEAAPLGGPFQQAQEIAVEEINAAGGVKGRKIKMIYEDGGCNAQAATNSIQKLVNVDNVNVVIGGLCSGETLAAAPVAEANKVILFSPGSGSPDITTAGDYIFRNFPSDATSGSKVAKAAYDNGHTKVAILSEMNDYSQALKGVFEKTYEGLGGEVVVDETFMSEATDFRTQLTKIKDANPDGIYLASSALAQYSLALKQMGEFEFDMQIYTNEFAATEDILKDRANEVEGAIYAEPAFDDSNPIAQALFDKIKAKSGELSGALPPVYYATAYDAVYVIKEAVTECGEDTDCVKTFLYGLDGREGAAGSLTIDENGDPAFEYVLKQIKNGEVVEMQ